MTVELDIDPIYEEMLEQLDEEAPGDPKEDLARIVENQIHQSYQQTRNGTPDQ